ncbi:ABC transporter substrate-binding protein [Xylophilus sp. Leaf220]|uniref:ABC transporter substrate-binding protein n=1 Tax=Xylophilus sp. Leaf220 TaxID=1735686 RepID=UPI0006F8410E|nr:ABC transporter substrate-binding protein [Xylophilus sp. Leaf220]KQM80055.1 amino acid ABC transporter substrate-binding protein [Xylophilus sp. Leaf220]
MTSFAPTRRALGTALVLLAAFGGAQADQLADIKARGTLVCGTLTSTEPLGFQDPKTRQIVGFDVDMCAAIARRMGLKLEHRGLSIEQRIPELSTGRVDLVSAALGYTKERAQQVAFTAAHYQVPIRVMVRKGAGIDSFAKLADKRVSAVKSATTEIFARRGLPKTTIVTYQDGPSAFLALMQDKVDGFSTSHTAGLRYLAESKGEAVFIDDSLAWEPTALGVKKDEPALLAAVDQALEAMEKDGEIDGIWNRWYGPDTRFAFKREKKLTPISAFAQ